MVVQVEEAVQASVVRDRVLDRSLADTDPEVNRAISAELTRQQTTLEMIASENFAPVAVMQAQGSVLTNKYAEGYPGRRYYGGCEHVGEHAGLLRAIAEGDADRADGLARKHVLGFERAIRAVT